jgi:peptide/nickel transport system permease protein
VSPSVSTAGPAGAGTAPRGRPFGRLRQLGVAGLASAAVVAVATFAAIAGPLLAPYHPDLPNLSLAWVGPAGGHLLGYDFQGRDVLSRLLAGAQSAMAGPLAVVILSLTAGAALAVASAWRRGATDALVSSGLDILFAFPGILLAVLAATVFGAGLIAAAIALRLHDRGAAGQPGRAGGRGPPPRRRHAAAGRRGRRRPAAEAVPA